MSRPSLVQLALKESMTECDPPDALTGPLLPSLDIDTCTFSLQDAHHAVVVVEYALVFARQEDDEIVCDLGAAWRLLYRFDKPPKDEREFAASHGVRDAWLAWRGWLEATISWMGIPPIRLPPAAPDELVELGKDMFVRGRVIAASKHR